MNNGSDNVSSLRFAIIRDTKIFLKGVESGASDQQLQAVIRRIRDREQQLLHREGAVLDPYVWRILHSRFIKKARRDPAGSVQ